MSKATLTAAETYRRAIAKANDVYGTVMTVAGEAHFAALKAGHKRSDVSLEVASAAADAAFDAAQEAASGECDRATTAAVCAFADEGGIPK